MKLPGTTIHRSGASQKLIYHKRSYEADLWIGKDNSLNITFRTNPYGERKSDFKIRFAQEACPELLKQAAKSIGSIEKLQAIVAELRNTQV